MRAVFLLALGLATGTPPESAPTFTSTTVRTETLPDFLALPDSLETPDGPVWMRGWFWGVVATVVVTGVVTGALAARGGQSCFCLTPEGAPCTSCSP